ncbi:hypothetical protein [Spiroplasma ixodetis]|nr:hypothetical protein [Spiroplasma ixodetis]
MNSFNFIVSSTSTCGEKSVKLISFYYPSGFKLLNSFPLLSLILVPA